MTVKKLSKKDREEIKTVNENLVKNFIRSGGKTITESKEEDEQNFDHELRFTLRIPSPVVAMVDQCRKTNVGKISRNTWILEAIEMRLNKKEKNGSSD